MKTNVIRENGRVWIEGVPAEKPVKGIWHYDGAPASLRAVLQFKGVEEKYLDDTIFAAILGQPFRFWFSDDFVSCLAYTHEAPLGVIAAETLGFDYVWHPGGYGGTRWEEIYEKRSKLDKHAVEAAWKEMREEIDRGHPVVLFGGDPAVDPKAGPVVVTGYHLEKGLVYFLPRQSAPKWDDAEPECRQGMKAQGYRARTRPDETNWIGDGFAPSQGMGGAAVCFFALKNRVRTPSEKEVAVAVLRRAIAIGRGDAFDELRPYRKGVLKALDLLATTLNQGMEIRRQDPDWWFAMEGLAWPEFRKTPAAFLSRCATDFGGFGDAQKAHLKSAARSSAESAAQFDALWRLFRSVGPLDEYDDRVKTVGAALSSREFRTKAVDVIRRIRSAEEAAIVEIQLALKAEGITEELPPVPAAANPHTEALAALLGPLRGGPADRNTSPASREKPMTTNEGGGSTNVRRVYLEWQSLRQMNWIIRARLSEARFTAVSAAGCDTGGKPKTQITDQGKQLVIEAETSWASGGLVVELDGPTKGTIEFEVSDPYVRDRLTSRAFDLGSLRGKPEPIEITSKEWPITNTFLRVTGESKAVEHGKRILDALGDDRAGCVAALLRLAQEHRGTPAGAKLLLRAAGACGGGCNHGPLKPDGWDRAIAIYQQVMDQYPGTADAMNARWAHAFCHGTWDAGEGTGADGCDTTNTGKGDWTRAIELFNALFQASSDEGSKVAALRRTAELQCTYAHDLAGGLATYRRIMEAFPGQVKYSHYWSYRTCGAKWGTDDLAKDAARLLLRGTRDGEEARRLYERVFAGAVANPHTDALAALLGPLRGAAVDRNTSPASMEKPMTPAAAQESPGKATPDYSKLALKGDENAKDSFSLTVQAVARMYGIDVDYETVYALSGSGFAPGIHPPEDCRQLQRMHDRGQGLDIVAARLGLALRPLEFADKSKPWTEIREALARGEVVLTDRGWRDALYTFWGVILDAPANGPVNDIRGATLTGRADHRLDHVGRCWAVTLGKPTMTPEQADVAMLQRAAARIRGDKPPFLPGNVVYGLKAMDLWIADMKMPSFQPGDPASSLGNAACCALYTSEGGRDVCSYLRRRLATFPEGARPHVAAAADQYDLIWRTLKPFAVPTGGYAGVIGDQARQKDHADKVLLPCKEALTKAADHLEKALTALNMVEH